MLGTLLNLAVTIPAAFAFSQKRMLFRRPLMLLFMFTMYFAGGIIPSFILVRQLGMYDTRWALIIPGALSVFNMIITRTFYESSIPGELYEASRMDGSSEFGNFFRIALPLSGPIVAVMALFYASGHWNAFFNALIYLNNSKLFPLQLVLRNIIIANRDINWSMVETDMIELYMKKAYLAEQLKYVLVFIACVPLLIAYPFVQKFFVKGVMIGAIKG